MITTVHMTLGKYWRMFWSPNNELYFLTKYFWLDQIVHVPSHTQIYTIMEINRLSISNNNLYINRPSKWWLSNQNVKLKHLKNLDDKWTFNRWINCAIVRSFHFIPKLVKSAVLFDDAHSIPKWDWIECSPQRVFINEKWVWLLYSNKMEFNSQFN